MGVFLEKYHSCFVHIISSVQVHIIAKLLLTLVELEKYL
jgi:hypothetical protein